MKSLKIKLPFTLSELLNVFDQLDASDLQRIADKVSRLLATKRQPTPEEEEARLLAIINKSLPKAFLERYKVLQSEMETGTLAKSAIPELEAYVEKIEEIDTQKLKALQELSVLRQVPFQQLAQELSAFSKNHG